MAASPAAAGCMTAEHAKQLGELYAWRQSAEVASSPPVVIREVVNIPAPAAVEVVVDDARPIAPVAPAPDLSPIRADIQAIHGHQAAVAQDLGNLARRLDDLEQRQSAQPQPPIGFYDDGSLPALLGGKPAPANDTHSEHEHAIRNLRSEVEALTDMVRKLTEVPVPEPRRVDPRAEAIEAVRMAAHRRRVQAMPGGSAILAIKMAEVAHLARAGQDGPMALMATIAEARGNGAWQEAAADIVEQADSLARVCVRTWAVEIAAIDEIERAKPDMIATIGSGATAALAAIQG